MKREFPKTTFKPWVGLYYDKSPLGLRLLILGESHYRSAGDKSPEEWTTNEALKHGRHTHRYWTRLSGVLGKHQQPYQADIWDSVVFYNYVQHVVGTAPRQRRASECGQASRRWRAFAKSCGSRTPIEY